MKCNICGNNEFIDMNARKSVRCSNCHSLERTRLMALFINYYKLVNKETTILHLSPEKGLADFLYNIAGDNCTFADLNPEKYSFAPGIKKIDLCHDLEDILDNSFDLIIHSHVLEHLPCNYTYVLYHLHRIMTRNSRMICSIPFLSGFYDCCASPDLNDNERTERFGQNDHVRKFGRNDLQMTLGKIYKIEDEYDITRFFSSDKLLEFNIPEISWKYYSPNSVLCLEKNDYLLK